MITQDEIWTKNDEKKGVNCIFLSLKFQLSRNKMLAQILHPFSKASHTLKEGINNYGTVPMGQQEAHEQNNKWKQAFREQASPKSASAKKGSFI